MLRIVILILIVIVLVAIAAVACSQLGLPIPATPTPIPTPTPVPTPTPTLVPATDAELGAVSDFTAHLNGLAVEGSFNVDEASVQFTYRPDHVEADDPGLRVSGTLTYEFLDSTHSVSDLGALLMPVDDACDQIGLKTDPVEFSQFGVSIPSQQLELDLSVLDQTSASVPAEMICRATRLVTEQANNPLTQLLVRQINRLLQQ